MRFNYSLSMVWLDADDVQDGWLLVALFSSSVLQWYVSLYSDLTRMSMDNHAHADLRDRLTWLLRCPRPVVSTSGHTTTPPTNGRIH